MNHLAVLLAVALFSPVFAAPPKTPQSPKAPKAPKVATEKGSAKAPGGKAIIGPSSKSKKAAPSKEKGDKSKVMAEAAYG